MWVVVKESHATQRSLNWLLIYDSGEHVLVAKKPKNLEKAITRPL